MPIIALRKLGIVAALLATAPVCAQHRAMRPDDLFNIQRVGGIAWSPDGTRALFEISRPGRWLDLRTPTGEIRVLDAGTGQLRAISPRSSAFVGFFGGTWSPTGRDVAFFSVDTNAIVRPWLWRVGSAAPSLLQGLQLRDAAIDGPVALWSDADHLVLMVRDSTRPPDGPLYTFIQRGRNAADRWRLAREGRVAAAAMVDSRPAVTSARSVQLISLNVRTGSVSVLARGALHHPTLSADRRTVTFRIEEPPIPQAPVATFFAPGAEGEAVYDLVNWGGGVRHVDARSGARVPAPDSAAVKPPAGAHPTLRVIEGTQGTSLVLGRPGMPDREVWHGNAWIQNIDAGRAEAISYRATTGAPLTGWLLYPPGYTAGRPIPIVAMVYPGTIYGQRAPSGFDVLNENVEHPQLLAALGYGVLLPSMPEPERPLQSRALDSLPAGVLPLLDTIVARGIADPKRIALFGHSAGGYAALGLITQTDRFRTAIASAGYSDLTSLYGTFYGQYREGDGGGPERAQVLRMLQFERGYFGAEAPPWERPERYRDNSPIERVAQVHTPLLLVHGDVDFVPIQQAEQFFTALYRQDKRVRLLHYAGEGHTISARANVLDLWQRLREWLTETMPPGS